MSRILNQKQASIRMNFFMNSILTMSSFVFPLITFPYVSRVLLPEGCGKVAFVGAVVAYFNLFAQLGIPVYGIRLCAQVRDNREELTRISHELVIINTIMAVLSYSILAFLLANVQRFQEDKALYVVISSTIILTDIGMNWLYQALEQYTYITIRSLLFKVLAIIAMFVLVRNKDDYVVYGAISIFAGSASNICNFINARKFIDFRPVGNYNLKRHLKPILIFFAMSCATTIYTNLDTVMLGFITNDEEVGLYNAAVKIKGILVSVVTSLGTVLLPRASYYYKNNQVENFYAINQKAISFVLLTACPLCVYFILFAKQSVLFLSGEKFIGATPAMQIIMPTLIFIGISNILGIQILVPMEKEKIVLLSEILGATTDVLLNYILIPKYGAVGAAIGTLVAEFVVMTTQMISMKTIIKGLFSNQRYAFGGMALIFSSLLGGAISTVITSNFWCLLVSAVVYFGVYGVTLLVVKEPVLYDLVSQGIRFIKSLRK